MDEAVNYRCISETCGRAFPRAASYCPYCGTNQSAQSAPRDAAKPPAQEQAKPTTPVAPVVEAPAVATFEAVKPPQRKRRAGPPPVERTVETPAPVPTPAPENPAPSTAGPTLPETSEKKRGKKSKWPWVLASVVIGLYWLGSVGNETKLEEQSKAAVAFASECKIDAAKATLAEMQNANATDEQMQKARQAIGQYGPECAKRQKREQAWGEAKKAVEDAISTGAFDKAESRLAAFIRRWDEDADTRELREQIQAGNAARLLNEAQACLESGNAICVQQRLSALEKRERPELADRILAMKETLATQQQKAAEPPPVATPTPAPAAIATPPSIAAPAPVTAPSSMPAPTPAANPNAVFIDSLLRDGEAALAAQRYREAMTNANNVLRLEHDNRRARSLLERARSAEFRALQEETIIR
ncbi:hypothetical protein [Noviherbaspirillum aridicola]|uniref:Zinc ribbon domain-containing protein n=1 Tax=Noviherbaspirillum aridicola TaxID=2849687 RepID=A0ABQ4Q1P7_9BURK|nr:hypothetical protein [Noviherbaspirillum aridicola]GIZ51113.1 hypothetical protein NCCP691_11270 [Noviherbaspirillum aridicola]